MPESPPERRAMRHAFAASTVAERYGYRAPYCDEVYETVLRCLEDLQRVVLDAGCGTGKLCRPLAPQVDRIDAVDPSGEMLAQARSLPGGDAPNLRWLQAEIESARLEGPYGMVVAGAAVHWFDLPVALALFARALHPRGLLVVLDGDGAVSPPWQEEEHALMLDVGEQRTGVRPRFEPRDPETQRVLEHPQFALRSQHVTRPSAVRQSIDDYVRAQQSRASLSLETLGPALATEHEARLRALLSRHATGDQIEFDCRTRIEWGRPLAAPPLG